MQHHHLPQHFLSPTCKNSHVGNLGFNASIWYAAWCRDGKIIEFWAWWYWMSSWYLSGLMRMSSKPFCMFAVLVVCWLSRDDAAFPLVAAVNDDTDEADEAENEAATLVSTADASWWAAFLLLAGLEGAGGGVALCESTVECGLMIRSDTDDAEDESMLMVLFEFVGENCWSCWLSGL